MKVPHTLRSLLAVCPLIPAGPLTAAPATRPALDPVLLIAAQGASRGELDITRCQNRISSGGATAANIEALGWAFVARARMTQDDGYYSLAARTAAELERLHGSSDDALLLRGNVLENQHHFAAAEQIARRLVADRDASIDYALLSDSLMEQGRLTEAIAACQELVNRRPGLEAYSRIAHLRWLKGQNEGAIRAMSCALDAVPARDDEARAWVLTRLANYHLQLGDGTRALENADAALCAVPDYAPARLARGKTLLALGRIKVAQQELEAAAHAVPLPEYQWWLAEAQRANGRPEAAALTEAVLRRRGAAADPRTLALFLATRGEDLPQAVALAAAELKNRADVFTHDANAAALFAAGDITRASSEIALALSEGTRDARILLHAARIAAARGDRAQAGDFFARARPLSNTLVPSERALIPPRAVPAANAVR